MSHARAQLLRRFARASNAVLKLGKREGAFLAWLALLATLAQSLVLLVHHTAPHRR